VSSLRCSPKCPDGKARGADIAIDNDYHCAATNSVKWGTWPALACSATATMAWGGSRRLFERFAGGLACTVVKSGAQKIAAASKVARKGLRQVAMNNMDQVTQQSMATGAAASLLSRATELELIGPLRGARRRQRASPRNDRPGAATALSARSDCPGVAAESSWPLLARGASFQSVGQRGPAAKARAVRFRSQRFMKALPTIGGKSHGGAGL